MHLLRIAEMTVNESAVCVIIGGGYRVIIDASDAHLMNGLTWHCTKATPRGTRYVYTSVGGRKDRRTIYLHRHVMQAQDGEEVDHRNRNGLDNRRANLRSCTHEENMKNVVPRRNGSSQYKGVRLYRGCKRWAAIIQADGKAHDLGYFDTEIEAARAYDTAALALHGQFARLNFPDEGDVIDPDTLPVHTPLPRPAQTHCKRGHEYTPDNTITWRGSRKCRECDGMNRRERYKKAAAR
jgi:hypothetical protein